MKIKQEMMTVKYMGASRVVTIKAIKKYIRKGKTKNRYVINPRFEKAKNLGDVEISRVSKFEIEGELVK